MAEQNKLFREKSLKSISSPEQLNDYVRVATPSVWIMIAAVILLILGGFIWASYSTISAKTDAFITVENGEMSTYVSQTYIDLIDKDAVVVIEEEECFIKEIMMDDPITPKSENYQYLCHISDASNGDMIYKVILDGNNKLPDGNYMGEIFFEVLRPIDLLVGDEE